MYRRYNEIDLDEISTEIDPKKKYSKPELNAIADKLLREDTKSELCRECMERGDETGNSIKQSQSEDGVPITDESGKQLVLEFQEYKCANDHLWYQGEGKHRGIGGENPILFEEHFHSRRRREIYCVDEKTQCLTKRLGWTRVKELLKIDEILSYDPRTDTTRWEPLQDVFIDADYVGDMISLKGQGFDAFVTPNHRWPVKRANKKGERWIEVCRTDELPITISQAKLPLVAEYESPRIPSFSDHFVRMVGWYVTEGHAWGRKSGPRIAITQSPIIHPKNVAWIEDDLDKLEANFEQRTPGFNAGPNGFERYEGLHCRKELTESGSNQFILSGTEVDKFIEVAGWNKALSPDFLTSLTQSQLHELCQVLRAGDGGTNTNAFHQWSEARMNGCAMAFVLDNYHLSQASRSDYLGLSKIGKRGSVKWIHRMRKIETTHFEGLVWCPVTPSGFWLARRNGTTYLTGNTVMGTPDPSIVQGSYNRTHPQGRRVNDKNQRAANGASFYRASIFLPLLSLFILHFHA